MSALGQKQTFRSAIAMSALPPKADMCSATRHVRFVPEADIESGIRFKQKTPSIFPDYKLNGLLPRLAATLRCRLLMLQVLC
jgi:hypothetical protein